MLTETKLDGVSKRQQAGEVWKQIQSKYGEKPVKQREVKKRLDKDDFMKIMITQMQHQDPTNPMDSDKLAAEIAQITSVEQLQNLNQSIRKMSQKNKPLERMAMTNLIGKIVTVDENRFVHVSGQNEHIKFSLPEDISSGKLVIISSKGEKVIERDLGNLKKGENSFNWNGKKDNTVDALTGTFLVKIEAENANGSPVYANALSKSKIIGVSFEGNEPVFIIGNASQNKRISMDSIITIEESIMASGQNSKNPNQPLGLLGDQRQVNKFFSFEKGKGSKTVDPITMNSELKNLLKSYKPPEKRSNPQVRKITPGFPNGLGKAKLSNKGGAS